LLHHTTNNITLRATAQKSLSTTNSRTTPELPVGIDWIVPLGIPLGVTPVSEVVIGDATALEVLLGIPVKDETTDEVSVVLDVGALLLVGGTEIVVALLLVGGTEIVVGVVLVEMEVEVEVEKEVAVDTDVAVTVVEAALLVVSGGLGGIRVGV